MRAHRLSDGFTSPNTHQKLLEYNAPTQCTRNIRCSLFYECAINCAQSATLINKPEQWCMSQVCTIK